MSKFSNNNRYKKFKQATELKENGNDKQQIENDQCRQRKTLKVYFNNYFKLTLCSNQDVLDPSIRDGPNY